jgi:hypothetical protein
MRRLSAMKNRRVSAVEARQPAAEQSTVPERTDLDELIRQHRYEAGELLLEQAMPPMTIIPNVSLADVVANGVQHMQPQWLTLMNAEQVHQVLQQAMNNRLACSVIRLGDGELLTLAQDIVYSSAEVSRRGPFLPYAGVHPPDIPAREMVAQAVREATIVGVPVSRKEHYQPLLFAVLDRYGIRVRDINLTVSTINYSLYLDGLLEPLLRNRKILLIGNAMPSAAQRFIDRGFIVTDIVAPVNGCGDIERVMDRIRGIDFDIALVSAGVAAVVIVSRIASRLGKVAVDFGHMADIIGKGEVRL